MMMLKHPESAVDYRPKFEHIPGADMKSHPIWARGLSPIIYCQARGPSTVAMGGALRYSSILSSMVDALKLSSSAKRSLSVVSIQRTDLVVAS